MSGDFPALAVLAGGKGLRMGGINKAALQLGRQTFLEHIAREFAFFPEKLYLGGASAALLPGFSGLGDVRPGLGPMGGLCAALAACRSPVVFAVACDMPLVTRRAAEQLMAAMVSARCDAAFMMTDHGIEPLCALYSKNCLKYFRQMIDEGDYALRHIAARVRWVGVRPDDPRQLLNVNTPADYSELQVAWPLGAPRGGGKPRP